MAQAQALELASEAARARREALGGQLDKLRDLLEASQRSLGLREESFRDALSCSLGLLWASALQPGCHAAFNASAVSAKLSFAYVGTGITTPCASVTLG